MNLQSQIMIMAAANPFPLTASFEQLAGGGLKCKLCQKKISTQAAAVDHLLKDHRTMASADRLKKMKARRDPDRLEAGGPGSGRHKGETTGGTQDHNWFRQSTLHQG